MYGAPICLRNKVIKTTMLLTLEKIISSLSCIFEYYDLFLTSSFNLRKCACIGSNYLIIAYMRFGSPLLDI